MRGTILTTVLAAVLAGPLGVGLAATAAQAQGSATAAGEQGSATAAGAQGSATAPGARGSAVTGSPGASAAKAKVKVKVKAEVKDTGVPDGVVVRGLCRAAGRYTVKIKNDAVERSTDADLRIVGVAADSVWSLSTQTRTKLADNTTAIGSGDGTATADENGRISAGAATPYGLRHSFEFQLSEEGGEGLCGVKVSVGRTHTPAGPRSGVRARVGVEGLCSGNASYRALLDNDRNGVAGRFHLTKGGADQQWTGTLGTSTMSPGHRSGSSRSVDATTNAKGRLDLSGRTSRGGRNGFTVRIARSAAQDRCRVGITA